MILSDWRVSGLVYASEQGHASIIKNLLNSFPTEDESGSIDDTGPSRLCHVVTYCTHLAIANRHIDVINVDGGTLAIAAFRGQKRMIESLLKALGPYELPIALNGTARWQNEKEFALLLEYADNVDITPALRNSASANNRKFIELIPNTHTES